MAANYYLRYRFKKLHDQNCLKRQNAVTIYFSQSDLVRLCKFHELNNNFQNLFSSRRLCSMFSKLTKHSNKKISSRYHCILGWIKVEKSSFGEISSVSEYLVAIVYFVHNLYFWIIKYRMDDIEIDFWRTWTKNTKFEYSARILLRWLGLES